MPCLFPLKVKAGELAGADVCVMLRHWTTREAEAEKAQGMNVLECVSRTMSRFGD